MSVYGSYQDTLLQHNANMANPAVLHSHLAGRTDIADHATEKAVLVDSNGRLQVDVVSTSAGGDASLAEQQTQTAHLATIEGDTTSLDSKVTACNTGAVTVSSSVLPSGASSESTLSALNTKVTTCNTGATVVSSSALPTGASTESTLSALNTKVTTCNTGATVVSSSALPTGASTESTLSSLNGKVTACDTGAVAVTSSALPTGAATESTLSALNTKVTACDTGSVTVTSSALPSGAATESTLSTLNGKVTACDTSGLASEVTLGTLNGKVTQGYASIVAGGNGAQQVLAYGKNGTGDLFPIHITSNGDVEVEIADMIKGQDLSANSLPVVLASDQSTLNVKLADVVNVGSQGNIENNSTIATGAATNVLDISSVNYATLLYEDTATSSSDEVGIEVSLDNSTYYETGTIFASLNDAGTKRIGYYTSLQLHGMLYLRLTNKSSTIANTNVYATLGGTA